MALDFYYKSIRGICASTDQAFLALEKQFNSLQHQAQARTYLGNLTIAGIIKEKDCSTLEALELAHNRINDTVPSCGKEYQQPSHYCDFLQRIVEDQPWARLVIQSRLTPGPNDAMDYNTFYSKLCAAVTAEGTNKSGSTAKQSPTPAPVFFGERYAASDKPRARTAPNRPRGYSRDGGGKLDLSSMIQEPNRIKGRMSATQLAQLKARTRCLRCRQYGHWRHKCTHKSATPMKDVMLFMVRQLGNDDNAVAALWCIAEDDDEWLAYMSLNHEDVSFQGDSSKPANAFEAIINSIQTEPYTDEDACKDLVECFDDLSTQFVGQCSLEDPDQDIPAFLERKFEAYMDFDNGSEYEYASPYINNDSGRPTVEVVPGNVQEDDDRAGGKEFRMYHKSRRFMRRLLIRRSLRAEAKTRRPFKKHPSTLNRTRRKCRRHKLYTIYSSHAYCGYRRTVPRDIRRIEQLTYIIPNMAKQFSEANNGIFHGGAIDTGAQKAVISFKQAKAYCQEVGIEFRPIKSNLHFRFGAGRAKSLGNIPVVISTPHTFLTIWVDVVPQDIPFLVGLDILVKYSLQILSVTNELECVREGWRLPVKRNFGLIYWEWSKLKDTFFSRPQLERLHRHLLHPSTRKLYNLLRRASPDQLSADTKKTLEEIQKTCETCQLYAPKQFVFRIRDTDTIKFNQEIRIDIVYLDGLTRGDGKRRTRATYKQLPVLHIVDVGTKFQNAAFLPAMDTITIWNTFVEVWAAMYVGFPESMLTDQGSAFVSKESEYNCELAEIELRHTGTESHNSLGVGETYHALLRRAHQKTRAAHPTVEPDVSLALTIKAINSTVGPDGLCPQLLVFGVMPRLPGISKKDFPPQKERLRALQTARDENEKLVSKALVDRGIKSIPPPAADHKYMPGDFVYVYRDGVKHYTGPHLVASVDGKQVRLHVGEQTGPRDFNISQLRPAPLARLQSMDELLTQDNVGTPRILQTEVLYPTDPRTKSPLFDDAKRKELAGLIEKGTFRIVLMEEIPNPNIIPCRFVLALKHSETGETIYKARFVLGGHRDKDKNSIVHNTVNVKYSSIRLLMALATILGFDVWSFDVKQAYIQSASALKRNLFIKPRERILRPNELIQVLRPLYGLSDSGDYWCETFFKFHIDDLRMKQAIGDFALFFRRCANSLFALSGSYVYDVLQAAPKDAKEEILRQIKKHFKITVYNTAQFVYTGIMCDTGNPNLRKMSQSHYIKKLQYLPNTADFATYRSLRAKLMWAQHTRPDIACSASLASRVTEKTFSPESVQLLNRILKHLKHTPDIFLQYHKLDQTHSDSSFTPTLRSRICLIASHRLDSLFACQTRPTAVPSYISLPANPTVLQDLLWLLKHSRLSKVSTMLI